MAATEPALPTMNDVLAAPLRVGEPDVHGPLAVFPLFGPAPVLEYVAFADGSARGVVGKELADAASVRDLVVVNPTAAAVLPYEGEEVVGARQNRTFDVSVLVPAGASLRVPVSCVEHARWDGARHDEAFSPAPRAAYPSLRRMKNATAHARVAAGLEARAEPGAVWAEVAAKSDRLDVASDTGAMHDIYERRRDALRRLRRRGVAARGPDRRARRDRRPPRGARPRQPPSRVRHPAPPARPGLRARCARGRTPPPRRPRSTPPARSSPA